MAAAVANAICNVTIARKRDYLITLEKQISLREHPRERELRRRTTFRLRQRLCFFDNSQVLREVWTLKTR